MRKTLVNAVNIFVDMPLIHFVRNTSWESEARGKSFVMRMK